MRLECSPELLRLFNTRRTLEEAERDLREAQEKRERFTLIFEGDLRQFKGNPLWTETPFGVPVAMGLGDAFAAIDRLEDAAHASPDQP